MPKVPEIQHPDRVDEAAPGRCAPALIDPGTSLTGAKLSAFMELVEELVRADTRRGVQPVRGCLSSPPPAHAAGYGYQYLDGSTPTGNARRLWLHSSRARAISPISLKAGGQGLNLTAADYVIHLDPWWNPAVEDQASDRAYRLGQQRPVTVYRLVARGTVEESILKLHRSKRALAADVLEGTDVPLSEAELMDLIRR
ncbi:MAG: helicase-related protein [Bilophila wadsworthia]